MLFSSELMEKGVWNIRIYLLHHAIIHHDVYQHKDNLQCSFWKTCSSTHKMKRIHYLNERTRDRIYMELWLTLDRIWILHQSLHSEKWSDKHVLFTAWLIGLGNENVQVSRDQLGNNIFYNTQKSFLQCNLDLFCFCNQRRITLLNLMINNCKIWNCIYMRICVSRFSWCL